MTRNENFARSRGQGGSPCLVGRFMATDLGHGWNSQQGLNDGMSWDFEC